MKDGDADKRVRTGTMSSRSRTGWSSANLAEQYKLSPAQVQWLRLSFIMSHCAAALQRTEDLWLTKITQVTELTWLHTRFSSVSRQPGFQGGHYRHFFKIPHTLLPESGPVSLLCLFLMDGTYPALGCDRKIFSPVKLDWRTGKSILLLANDCQVRRGL